MRVLYLLTIFFLPSIIFAQSNSHVSMLDKISTTEGFEQFIEELLAARPILTDGCKLGLYRLIKAMLKREIWAFEIFDASAKLPSGLLRGHGAALGTFDECINAKSEFALEGGVISGKYCQGSFLLANLTNVEFEFPIELRQTRLMSFKEASITLPWGACFPNTCTAKDLETLHLGLLRFNEENCQTKSSQTRELDDSDIAAIAIIGAIVLLVILSTAYDIFAYFYKEEDGSTLLRSFSLITNGIQITTIKEQQSNVSALHGLRVLSMFTIMGGMRYFLFVFAPLHNWVDLLKWITDPDNSVILELMVCMDTFLLISGFLISYKYMKMTSHGKTFNVFTYYVNRIVRLTPPLAILVLFNATLLRHMGSGPLWPKIRGQWLVDNCREYWWSSLLYVQNYVNPRLTDICVLPTWQLSVNMQLFLLSPLILFPLKRWPKITLCLTAMLFGCSAVGQFLLAWFYKIKGVLVMLKSLNDMDNYFQHFFFPTHTRAAPWLVGIILGYVVFNVPTNKSKIFNRGYISKLLPTLFWILSITVLLLNIFLARIYVEHDYDQLSHSVLLGVIRPLWSIGVAWIVYACAGGYGGPVNTLLSSSSCIVLSRLSYSIYLVYFTVMFFFTYQTRLGLEFNHLDAIYRIFADITISILVGFIWSLFFESPFISLTKYFKEKDLDKDNEEIPK